MNRIYLTPATMILSATVVAAAPAAVINVPGNASSIQTAINMAQNGDEIRVAPGTYYENIDLLGKAVTLVGTAGAATTILDATGQNDTAIRCDSGEDDDTVIRGLTIRGGTGDTTNWSNALGGGMFCFGADPTLIECVFRQNRAYGGGAVFSFASYPEFRDCQFVDNEAFGNGGFGSGGGAIGNSSSDPTFLHCSFVGNTAANEGGAMVNSDSDPMIANCEFIGNRAALFGGAMNNYASKAIIVNSTFTRNSAIQGGAMKNFSNGSTANLTIENCIISGNGAIELMSSSGAVTTVTDSIVAGGWSVGSGIINADPVFTRTPSPGPDGDWGTADDDWGNLCPTGSSPAIDAGDTAAVPAYITTDLDGNARVMGTSVDMGAYEANGGVVVELCPADVNDNGMVNMDDVLSVIAAWDLPCNGCPEDMSPTNSDGTFGNGDVNIDDLLFVIEAWGECP